MSKLSASLNFNAADYPPVRLRMNDTILGPDILVKEYDVGAISEVSLTLPSFGTGVGWIIVQNISDDEHIEVSTGTGGTFAAHADILEPGWFIVRTTLGQLQAMCISAYGTTGRLRVWYQAR